MSHSCLFSVKDPLHESFLERLTYTVVIPHILSSTPVTMAIDKFPIPDEFKSAIRYVDALDKRSDAEILHSLTKHVPITSERNTEELD